MISLIPGASSGRRSLLIAAGVLLIANGALGREGAFDPQEQARHFIVPRPDVAAAIDATTRVTATAARGAGRVGPQEQARQFILATPNGGAATDARARVTATVAAPGNARVDPLEQARQFIVAKPKSAGIAGRVAAPVSNTDAASTVTARSSRGI